MGIGAKIKASRLAVGLGQTAAARAAGITKPGLWKIESGRTKMPQLPTLKALAKVYGVKISVWCGG